MIKNKIGNFAFGINLIVTVIAISLLAFISEDNKITGFAVLEDSNVNIVQTDLIEIKDMNELGTLSPGNYYIDDEGIVYYTDIDSNPAIAKVQSIEDLYKNKHIYIDKNGNVGYILTPVLVNEE